MDSRRCRNRSVVDRCDIHSDRRGLGNAAGRHRIGKRIDPIEVRVRSVGNLAVGEKRNRAVGTLCNGRDRMRRVLKSVRCRAQCACAGIEDDSRVFGRRHDVVGNVGDGRNVDGDSLYDRRLRTVRRQNAGILAIIDDRNAENISARGARPGAVVVGSVEIGQTVHSRVHLG